MCIRFNDSIEVQIKVITYNKALKGFIYITLDLTHSWSRDLQFKFIVVTKLMKLFD